MQILVTVLPLMKSIDKRGSAKVE